MIASSQAPKRLYTPTFLLFNLLHLFALTANALFLLFPLYLQQNGLPKWEIGSVMAGFSVAAVLSRPLLGHPMDVWGRRPFVIFGLLLGCLAAVSYDWAGGNPVLLAFIRFVQGIGVASYFTAAFTWVVDLAPPARLAEALGFFGMSGLLTMATGSATAEFVVTHYGFSGLFQTAALGFLSAAALALLLGRADPPTRPDEGEDARSPSIRDSAAAFRAIAGRPALLPPTLGIFIYGAGTTAVGTFIAPYLQTTTGGAHEVTRFYLGYTASAVVVRLLAGRLIDQVGYNRLVGPALLSLGCGIGLLSLVAPSGAVRLWTTVAGLLLGIGHGIVYPSLSALTISRVSDHERAKAMSLFTASTDVGGIVGALGFGLVATAFGYPTMFLLVGLMSAGSVAMFSRLERRHAP